mmetsp:Transcript_38524/g.68946  ORF Transcript_38524/g.68946 Transcript_38524/m.68946 type:complete len:106 (-) Transcript_38524:100-417(-)
MVWLALQPPDWQSRNVRLLLSGRHALSPVSKTSVPLQMALSGQVLQLLSPSIQNWPAPHGDGVMVRDRTPVMLRLHSEQSAQSVQRQVEQPEMELTKKCRWQMKP